jgi:hypothetical protein
MGNRRALLSLSSAIFIALGLSIVVVTGADHESGILTGKAAMGDGEAMRREYGTKLPWPICLHRVQTFWQSIRRALLAGQQTVSLKFRRDLILSCTPVVFAIRDSC